MITVLAYLLLIALSYFSVRVGFCWCWNRLCRHNRCLDVAVQRHPAGTTWEFDDAANPEVSIRPGVDGWVEPDGFPFRARPCAHKLFAPSVDEVLHVELLHVDFCPIAQEALSRRRAA